MRQVNEEELTGKYDYKFTDADHTASTNRNCSSYKEGIKRACPFCGSLESGVNFSTDTGKAFVICFDCQAHGPEIEFVVDKDSKIEQFKVDAFEAWNKRVVRY